ncbi:hypothetical protein [Gordonia sp. KTR9]|uniref:hypothetical protein n=1 Tax=Gordonia sp. KTR9 TaxID=337191 RepID=UPI00130EC960|nr:hypothetical protein [Gordonia sp. KTR9]
MPTLIILGPAIVLLLIGVGLTLFGQWQSKVRDPQPIYRAAAGLGVLAIIYAVILSSV